MFYLSRTDLKYPTTSLVFFLSSTLGSISWSCSPWYWRSQSSESNPTSGGRCVIFVLFRCSDPSLERTPISRGRDRSSLFSLNVSDWRLGKRQLGLLEFAGVFSVIDETEAGRCRGSRKWISSSLLLFRSSRLRYGNILCFECRQSRTLPPDWSPLSALIRLCLKLGRWLSITL